jgi:two-component system chemotaxis sensor kinase CheA
MARSLRELREAVTRVRLVSVAEIFNRVPFVIRDLVQQTGKKVRLQLEGQQTEVDKFIVERLKEPVLHLVRNAFSHGVELPEQRAAAGKAEEATLELRAYAAGDTVTLQIRDDGRGVNRTAVIARATRLGMALPPVIDEAALLAILCAPGFSTRDEADRSLTLETELGRSTVFTLRLPLTLSITEAVLMDVGGQTFAIPQNYVRQIFQIERSDLRKINQVEVVPYQDGLLPVRRLAAVLGLSESAEGPVTVLVLNVEQGAVGLLVDRVTTQREIVVRPLQDPLVQVPGIFGATELGDGRPVLILDATALSAGAFRAHQVTTVAANP